MKYKRSNISEEFENSIFLNQWRNSNKNQLTNKSKITSKQAFVPNFEELKIIQNDMQSHNQNTVNKAINNFSLIIQKNNFSFSQQFYDFMMAANINRFLYNRILFEINNHNEVHLLKLLTILINLSSEGYSNIFKDITSDNYQIIIRTSFNIFRNSTNVQLSIYSLSIIANFISDSIDFRNDFLDNDVDYLSTLVEYAQDKKCDLRIRHSVFLIVQYLTYFELNSDQIAKIVNIILFLLDFMDEITMRNITASLRMLSKYDYNDFLNILSNPKIQNFLSSNLTSSDISLVVFTLLIYETLFQKISFQEIPDLPKIIKYLNSKSDRIAITSCKVMTAIFKNSSDSIKMDDRIVISKELVNNIKNRSLSIKNESFNCLLWMTFAYQDVSYYVSEDFIISLIDLFELEDDILIFHTLTLLHFIFSIEFKNENGDKPMYESFCNNDGLNYVNELSQNQNSEISALSQQILNYSFM